MSSYRVLLERVDMLGRFGATLVFVRGAMFGRALGAVFGRAFTLGRFSWPTFGRAFGTVFGRAFTLGRFS